MSGKMLSPERLAEIDEYGQGHTFERHGRRIDGDPGVWRLYWDQLLNHIDAEKALLEKATKALEECRRFAIAHDVLPEGAFACPSEYLQAHDVLDELHQAGYGLPDATNSDNAPNERFEGGTRPATGKSDHQDVDAPESALHITEWEMD